MAVALSLQVWTSLPVWVSWVIAFAFGWMPLLGQALAIYGAHVAWGWTWTNSMAAFSMPPLAAVLWFGRRRPNEVGGEARAAAAGLQPFTGWLCIVFAILVLLPFGPRAPFEIRLVCALIAGAAGVAILIWV